MELSVGGRRLRVTASLTIGLVLIVAGLILLFIAYDAQLEINNIGTTDDPDLLSRISQLEDRRDSFLVMAIGSVFMGLFAVALLGEPNMPALVSGTGMIATARMANEMTAALSVSGNASYLPSKRGLTKERMFVSSAKGPGTPPSALSDDMVISPGKDGSSPGILAEPFGLRLLDEIEKELGTGVRGAGLEAAEGVLQIMKHGMGMMKDFHFKERDGKTVLRVEYSGLREACRTVRQERPDTCRQMSCIGCSCLMTSAARATGKVVAVEDVDNKRGVVVFTLSLTEW